MRRYDHERGIVLCGVYPDPDVMNAVSTHLAGEKIALTIADPPYGRIVPDAWDSVAETADDYATMMLWWIDQAATLMHNDAALYLWGGIGTPGYRPFYKFMSRVEDESKWLIANHITWSKKRAYGIAHNYLFTREEVAYLILGDNVKRPRVFHVPLTDTLRGYPGYNEKYPAKSDYKRRTNVWTDVTEILRGKLHVAQKPDKLYEIIVSTHTDPDDVVFDPFGGSGTTGVACIATDRRFIIIESDPESFDLICARLAERGAT